jgi:hypothetical protein
VIEATGRERVGMFSGRSLNRVEVKGESEVDLQNQAKTRSARHKNDLVAMLIGHHLVELVALISSQVMPVGELEGRAVLNEEAVRVGTRRIVSCIRDA